jgi:hypothetical protein
MKHSCLATPVPFIIIISSLRVRCRWLDDLHVLYMDATSRVANLIADDLP